ncbi:AhpC/TSA family protein [Pedobacter sp. PAMC26386]|nr:AhpC/TSA family protein [Pedobacter sp. PAMC26386]
MKLKNSFLLAFLAITISVSAQQKKNTYTISGHLAGLKDKWIYSGKDSAQVKNDRFSFTGKISEPEMVQIYTKSESRIYLVFFVSNNATTNIEGKAASFNKAIITGPAVQTEYNRLNAETKTVDVEKEKLYPAYSAAEKAKDSTKLAVIEKKIDALDQQTEAISKTFIKKNPKSFVSAYQIREMEYSNTGEALGLLFKGLDPSIQKSILGKKLNEMIAIKKKTSVGKAVMEFTQPDTSGNLVSISSFKGKYVLLDFWASWCGPCRGENPNVLKAYNQFKDKGFTVFSVSIDENKEKWLKAIKEDHLPWTQASDLKKKNQAAEQFGIHAIPSNFLLDPTGNIIAVNLRGDALLKKLQEVIK